MRLSVSRVLVIVSLVLAAAACDGGEPKGNSAASNGGDSNVKWLSTGGSCEDLEDIKNNKEHRENLGFLFCGNAGHTFTGELRCEREYIEVQCR
jgi:hypothetical protein